MILKRACVSHCNGRLNINPYRLALGKDKNDFDVGGVLTSKLGCLRYLFWALQGMDALVLTWNLLLSDQRGATQGIIFGRVLAFVFFRI